MKRRIAAVSTSHLPDFALSVLRHSQPHKIGDLPVCLKPLKQEISVEETIKLPHNGTIQAVLLTAEIALSKNVQVMLFLLPTCLALDLFGIIM